MSAAIAPNPNDPQAPLGMPARPWWIGYIRQLHLDIPLAVESGGTGKADRLMLSDLGAYKATIMTSAAAITANEGTVYRLIGSGSRTVNLPSGSGVKSGAEVEIFIESPTITDVTITPAESENLISQGGAVDYVFTGLGKSVRMIRVGESQWNVIEPDVSLTAADIAETSALKILTADERTKLAGIAEGANNYTHPATHPQSMIEGLADALAGKAPVSTTVTTNTTQEVTGTKTYRTSALYYGPATPVNHTPFGFGCGGVAYWGIRQYTNGTLVWQSIPTGGGSAQNALGFIFGEDGSVPNLVLYNTPTAPTAAAGTNTTQLATTAFVQAKAAGALLTEGTPSGPTATGTKGMARFDADYYYVCTATNTWVRFAKDGAWT